MSDQAIHSSAPAVVPRWEWRTFGNFEDADEALAKLWTAARVDSDETYILSMHGDALVKVRDGLLDTKVLQRVNGSGLQLWVPTMKTGFPLDEGRPGWAAFAALGMPLPATWPSDHDLRGFIDELVGSRDDLRVVENSCRRVDVDLSLDACMVEMTERERRRKGPSKPSPSSPRTRPW